MICVDLCLFCEYTSGYLQMSAAISITTFIHKLIFSISLAIKCIVGDVIWPQTVMHLRCKTNAFEKMHAYLHIYVLHLLFTQMSEISPFP